MQSLRAHRDVQRRLRYGPGLAAAMGAVLPGAGPALAQGTVNGADATIVRHIRKDC